MRIYTRTGDRGETSLFGGKRVPKDDLRIETYGTVDELNSVLGIIRAMKMRKSLDRILKKIQNDLFVVGADLASPARKNRPGKTVPRIMKQDVTALEALIDGIEPGLRPLREFILPGGSPAAAHLHLARALCRRVERSAVQLSRVESINPFIVAYLNRLSDLLFILARWTNHRSRKKEIVWVRDRNHQ